MPARFTGTRPGYSYFIMEEDGDQVKIGWAIYPDERLRALQVGNPRKLVCLAWLPGTLDDEEKMHSRFRRLRGRGEWFRLTDELGAVIEEAIAMNAQPARGPGAEAP